MERTSTIKNYAARVLTAIVLLCTICVGNAWGDSYTITFSNSANSATAITSSVLATTTIASSSRAYVTTSPYTVNSGNCYYGDTQSCIRIGKSGNASSLSIALSTTGQVYATSIVVNCNNTGGTKNTDATLSVNEKTAQTTSETADDYTFSINDDITSITLAGSASIKIYSITVNYTAGGSSTPTITTSSSMTTFGCNMTTGVPTIQNFSVSGSNLSENLTVTPPSGYEICLTSGGTYQTSAISLTPSTGTVSSTTIYVRLKNTNAAGSYSGNIACASSGATTQNVAISGSTPFKVTWKANSTTVATTYIAYASGAGTALGSLPSDPDPDDYSCTGKAFYGWYDGVSYSNASIAPTTISTSTKITTDKTFLAVFADAEDGDPVSEWQKCTSLSDFVDGDFYLFVSPKYNNTYYYVPAVSGAATQGTFSSSADGNHVASNSTPTSITKAEGAWKLIKSSTAWKIQSSNASTIYLYSGTDNNKLGAATSATASNTWSITKNASTATFAFQYNSSRYLCAYDASPYGFRTYTGTGTNGTAYLTVYRLITSTPTVYSNYATFCCTALDAINGLVSFTDPTEAVVKWDMIGHVSSWTLKYKEHSNDDWTTAYTSKTSSDSEISTLDSDDDDEDDTYYSTISSLSCNTAYDFQIIANPASGYCDASDELTNQNSGKYAITLTDGGTPTGGLFAVTDGDDDVTGACNEDALYLEAVAADGYQFDNWEITYTSGGADAWDDVIDTGDADDSEIIIEMPAAGITVNAVFSCVSTTATVGPTTADGNYGWRYTTGETIDLTCSTSGATPTGYQWQKYVGSEWTDINKATNASAGTARLQIASCTSSDCGNYRCVVTTGTDCSFQSAGYFVRIFTLNGNYSGSSFSENAITWTGENTGTVTLSLNESSIYEFKVFDNDGKTFGNGTNNYIIQPVNWNCGTGNSNCRLFTGPEGNYTITLNVQHSGDNSPYVNVQVAYPSVTHPAEGYVYVSKWWDCYPHFWDGSGNALTNDGYDPQIETYTSICNEDYWYFPLLSTYVNVAVKDNATWASAGNNSGNQTMTDHSGMYLTHDGNSWDWHDFDLYTITFTGNGNSGGSMSDVSAICPSTNRTLSENGYTLTGYHFNGWKTNVAITINTGGDDQNIAANGIVPDEATIKSIGSDITLTAQWAPNTNTPYTVKHYKQKLDGTYDSTPDDTDNLTGTTATSVTPARKSYTGFTAPSGTEVTILADGSRIVEYQYSRNSYTLTWSTDGDDLTGSYTSGSTKYEASITAPNTPTKTGYTFSAWSPSVPSTMPAANSTYTATWTANTNTAYTVKHYKQKLDGTYDASPDETDNLTGTTATSVTPDRKSYTGFTAPDSQTETIAADGSLVVTYKYTRNKYNVAVASPSEVTIKATPSGGSDITEGNNADVYYGQSVTLASSSITSGYFFAGWKVTNAGGDDVTASVVSSNTLTVPAYAVTVSSSLYTNAIAWCDPDVEVTGDVHLTSTKDVYVHSTSGAGNLLNISSEDIGSATKMEVGYLDDSDDEVDKADSPFRLYNSTAASTVDEEDLDNEWDVDYSLRYTPTDYSQLHNYKLQLTFKHGDKVLKTVTHDINGRSLPEKFVIAVKNTNDSKWYALPSNLASTKAAQGVIALSPALEIEVDNTTTPTKATIAPKTRIYKALGRKDATNNISGIRFTTTGSNKMQAASDATYVWLPTSDADNSQVWQLASSDLSSYTVTMPSIGSKKLGIFANSGDKFGYAASPHSYGIYFLPVQTEIEELATTANDWNEHEVQVEADASSISATKVLGILGATTSDKETLPSPIATNTYLLKLDGDFDYTDKDGQTLQFKWYDSSDKLKAYSWVTVPSIILAGDKDEWSDFASAPTLSDIVVLTQPMVINTTTAKAKRIVIDKSSTNTGELTINADKGLVVAEAVKKYTGTGFVATTPSDVALLSSSAGTGALIVGEYSDNTQATVGFYTQAINDPSRGYVNQYIGVPFSDMTAYDRFYDTYIYEYVASSNAWSPLENNGAMTPFAAYNLMRDESTETTLYSGGTLYLPGTGVYKEKVLELTLRNDKASTTNMFANSYTAPIDIASFDEGGETPAFVGVEATIYIFNAGSKDDVSKRAAQLGSGAGQWLSLPVASVKASPGTYPLTVIPSQQAFMVKGATGENHKLTIDYKKHVYDPAVASGVTIAPTRAPKRTEADNSLEKLTVTVQGESGCSDRVLLFMREDFSDGYDNGWDGRKMKGKGYAPYFYAASEDGKMAVNAVPTAEGTVLGFKAGTNDDTYTMSFDYEGSETLYLKDTKTGIETLIDSYSEYVFYSETSDSEARFLIIKKSPSISTGVDGVSDGSRVRKLLIDDKLYIIRAERIYSADGALVK